MEQKVDPLTIHLVGVRERLGRCFVVVAMDDEESCMTWAAWYIACHSTQKN